MKHDKGEHHHTSLLSWLTHIKHHHDKKPIIQIIPPENHELINPSLDPVESLSIKHKDTTSSEDSSSTCTRSVSNIIHNRFKDNVMHLHRPHRLLNHFHSQRNSTESLSNHDDDETKLVLLETNSHLSNPNSIFTLPEDIDGPEVGFKKLRKDGHLVSLTESDIIEEEEDDQIDSYFELKNIDVNKTYIRSIIRNDLIQLVFNGPFQSPLLANSKKHVLHVGCGDGSWCIETALNYPNWLVVGMDDKTGGLSPDQRKVPRNFKYIRNSYDVLRTIRDIPSDSFDLVYSRFLIDMYGDDDYFEFIKECKRICKVDGYVELYELDMRIYGNPNTGFTTRKLNKMVFHLMEDNNLNPRMARKLSDRIIEVFQNKNQDLMNEDIFNTGYISLPLGIWGGKLGVMFRDSITDLYSEYDNQEDSIQSDKESINSYITCSKNIKSLVNEMESHREFMNLHFIYVKK